MKPVVSWQWFWERKFPKFSGGGPPDPPEIQRSGIPEFAMTPLSRRTLIIANSQTVV